MLNIIDLFILLLLLIGAIIGMVRGFVKEISGIVGTIAGIISIHYLDISQYIENKILLSGIMLLIFIVSFIITRIIIESLFSNIEKLPIFSLVSRILGAILVMIKTYLIISLSIVTYFSSISGTDYSSLYESILIPIVLRVAHNSYDMLKHKVQNTDIRDAIEEAFQNGDKLLSVSHNTENSSLSKH